MAWQDPRWAWLPSRPTAALPVLCGVPALPSPPSSSAARIPLCRVVSLRPPPSPLTPGLRGAARAHRRPSWDISSPEKRLLIRSSPAPPPCSPAWFAGRVTPPLSSSPLHVFGTIPGVGGVFPSPPSPLFLLNKLGQPMRFPLVSSPPSRGLFALGLKGGRDSGRTRWLMQL